MRVDGPLEASDAHAHKAVPTHARRLHAVLGWANAWAGVRTACLSPELMAQG